ncbi:unnamed protein product [Notodromas monacha]|uniref:Solute carrier family 12 member 9 n=1 Tax=Notodromas monacha TaxID=399045 RepID=A0A7R9BIE1_9CRUS|nr:unnamed protein product [Notodromas monacha]CAG0916069.1 unnamed protein product [Notodromas monacha]
MSKRDSGDNIGANAFVANRGNDDDTTKLKDYFDHQPYQEDELFADESGLKPWWTSNFLLRQPTLFGAWDGVFTSCLINILGVIVFLRSGWIVAEAGLWMSTLIVTVSVLVILTSVLSAIAICEMGSVGSGGVYSVLSSTLGSRVGGAFGLLYCFGNAVEGALHAAGFGESIAELFVIKNPWIETVFGIGLILFLVIINIAGVQWVMKFQFFLLLGLLLAVGDFLVGSLLEVHPEVGITGWSTETFWNNTSPMYSNGSDWFSVFGVFFPTVTGILAGVNMAGDLKQPAKDIPVGTLSAVCFSFLVYLTCIWILGWTCDRSALQIDFLIMEKEAFFGIFVLIGLYVSSVSTCLGVLYGTPRVLQSIAGQKIVPVLQPLEKGRGPNNVPVLAVLVVGAVTLVFVLIGQINRLAPIVTLPFLLTYAGIDYAHFALVQARLLNISSAQFAASKDRKPPSGLLQSPTFLQPTEEGSYSPQLGLDPEFSGEILSQPKSCYSVFCNHYVSLFACALKVMMVLLVHWIYGLAFLAILGSLYLYIGRCSQTYSPGLAHEFSFFEWIFDLAFSPGSADDHAKFSWRRFWKNHRKDYEEVIVGSQPPSRDLYRTEQSQVTDVSKDFNWRKPYHQATMLSNTDVSSHQSEVGEE